MTARKEDAVDHNEQEQVALHRWAVVAEAAGETLAARERGCWSARSPSGRTRTRTGRPAAIRRGTVDRWLRAWRAGGWRR
jgi:putative transposase